MDDLLFLALIIIASLIVGWRLREIVALRHMQSILEEQAEEEEQEELNVVEVNVEFAENMYFAYRRDNSSFLGNATSVEKLSEVLVKNHPKIDKFKVYYLS